MSCGPSCLQQGARFIDRRGDNDPAFLASLSRTVDRSEPSNVLSFVIARIGMLTCADISLCSRIADPCIPTGMRRGLRDGVTRLPRSSA